MRVLRAFALVAALVCLARPALSSTVAFRTDAELIARSERVVHARVVAQRSAWGGPQGNRIYTVTTLAVLEDFTGQPGETVDVWELGGRIGDQVLWVGGGVEYRVGEEVLVCLERGPHGLRSVAMNFSRFDVGAGAGDDRTLSRRLKDTVVQGGSAAAVHERTLGEFRQLAAQVTGRQSVRRTTPIQAPSLSAQEPFTKLGGEPGFRWVQADSGVAVTWYKNTSAPSPLVSGDAVPEIQTALAAWTNPSTASIILQYAGATFESTAEGPWSSIPASGTGSGLITFEDPNNELSGSTLAIGGAAEGIYLAGGTVNGTTFHAFKRGFVIFQNAADLEALSPSFRQSTNFTRVLEHEIGHAIGLGHTQTDGSVANATSNIMYPSCCATATPVPPAIGPDDLAGLNFIYPVGGSSCTYSLNPTSVSAPAVGLSGSVSVVTQAGCAWTASSNAGFATVSTGSGSGPGSVGYTVSANGSSSGRSGTLTVAGQTFSISQAGATCTFALSPTSASMTSVGGAASVGVTAPTGCSWGAVSNSAFITITSGSSGNGPGTVNYGVSANGVPPRTGTLTIGGQTFTLTQTGTGPQVTLDKTSLRYGATINGTTVMAQTSSQIVRLTQTAGPNVSWTATSNQPWLVVSPTSGSGARELTVSVSPVGLPVSGMQTATITFALTGAGNTVGPIGVTLVTMPYGTSANPFGVVDTPANNTTGVTGAVPFTGWALDDVEVANVYICRSTVTGETAGVDARCGSTAQVFIGGGVFIDGARPDVQGGFGTYPRNSNAGWGFMVLTNMLPAQGNGTFTFHVYAVDREGHPVLLGSRAMTCDNAHATTPFGTIDTPGQGETISGSSYANFAWALTQQPKTIPTDGSTMSVFVDGVSVGRPTYNNFRSDIATLFPGLQNSNGAVGFRIIDTTALTNGLHTIVWTATDSGGMTSGLGSRFFRVSNGSGALTAASTSAESEPVLAAPAVEGALVDRTPLVARRGWSPEAPWLLHAVGASGRAAIRGEELDRFELSLGEHPGERYTGYLRVGGGLAPLPVGSVLDQATGSFTWSPGLGFVGTYDLVFARWSGQKAVARQEIRFLLYAKGSHQVGPQVVIDIPTSQQDVGQPFMLAGWAADLNAEAGTGIDTLHVWAYPLTGAPPIFLGTASYGGARPDVAAVHGDQFRESGYGLVVGGLPHGNYDIAVFGWSSVSGGFVPPTIVRVTVR
jgi:hypothetical protein